LEVSLRRSSAKLARRTLSGFDSEPVRILLAEDNPRHAQLLRDAMGEAGAAFAGAAPYELAYARSIAETLEHLKAGGTDLVLLDLSLPDGTGLEGLLRVRELYPDTPVIALIGLNADGLATQALHAGAQDYLTKGRITGGLLARSVRYATQLNRLQMALRSLSFIDNLTSLYNRRGFMTLADPHVRLAQRMKGRFLIVSVDVAELGAINTASSYDEGDMVLRDVAELLRRTFRDSDILARLEGGSFMAFAVEADEDKAPIIVTRMQQHVAVYNQQTIRAYTLVLNVGIAAFDPAVGGAIEDLMARAVETRHASRQSRRVSRRLRKEGA
jgi:two-component system, cell cycle response regulator